MFFRDANINEWGNDSESESMLSSDFRIKRAKGKVIFDEESVIMQEV